MELLLAQVLKTRAFHTLWWMFLLQGQAQIFISTLYKVEQILDSLILSPCLDIVLPF